MPIKIMKADHIVVECKRCGKPIAKIVKEAGALLSVSDELSWCEDCKKRLFPPNIEKILGDGNSKK